MKATLPGTVLALAVAALAGFLVQHAPAPATFALTGDVMLGRHVAYAHSEGGWDLALSALEPLLREADAAFANLESPLTYATQLSSGYDLRASPESVAALSQAQFDILSLANNHALDAGESGLEESLSVLQEAGIQPLRTGTEPWRLQVGRATISWFAVDDTASPLNLDAVSAALRAEPGSNLIVVSIHWGRELEPAPTERQRALARALASSGADLIAGHHPHVLQLVEMIWGDGRGRPTLVAYSLGNALFDQFAPPDTQRGAVLRIEFNSTSWAWPCAFPFRIYPSKGRVGQADGSEASLILERLDLGCTVGSLDSHVQTPGP